MHRLQKDRICLWLFMAVLNARRSPLAAYAVLSDFFICRDAANQGAVSTVCSASLGKLAAPSVPPDAADRRALVATMWLGKSITSQVPERVPALDPPHLNQQEV